MIEALSKAVRGVDIGTEAVEIEETPEIDKAEERRPCISLARELDIGRFSRSGKRALTMVTKSEGPRTRYGWTSTVSLKDVIDLAGRSFALPLDGRLDLNLAIMFSIWPLIARGGDADLFLLIMSNSDTNMFEKGYTPNHIDHKSGGAHTDFSEDLLSPILGDVILRHHAIGLETISLESH